MTSLKNVCRLEGVVSQYKELKGNFKFQFKHFIIQFV